MTTQTNSNSADTGGADTGTQVSDTQVDVAGILNFDPFAPPSPQPTGTPPAAGEGDGAAAASGSQADGAAASAQQQQPDQQQQQQQQPQPGQQQSAPQPGQEQNLTTAIAQQTQAIRDMLAQHQQQQPQPQPGQQQQQNGQDQQQTQPKFNLGVPDQIVNAMASEDPKERSMAVHALVNGVANHVWQQTEAFVRSTVQEIVQSVPRVIEAHAETQRQQQHVAQDFFGTYEVFKNPAFVPLLQSLGMQVAQEWQGQGKQAQWNAEFRDAIAGKMFALFPMLKQQHDAAAAARGKGNGQQPPRPQPFRTGQGARPAPAPDNEFEQVLNTKF